MNNMQMQAGLYRIGNILKKLVTSYYGTFGSSSSSSSSIIQDNLINESDDVCH